MRILITGGAGLAGHALVDLLNEIKMHDFVVVDNLLYADEYLRNVEFQFGDVGDPKFMIPFLKKYDPDIVVHLAGVVGDAACDLRPREAKIVNVDSVKLLRDYFGGYIVFTSSCSVYGASEDIVTEESPVNPVSMYAQMKVQAEEILKDRALILRLGTLHGITGRLRNDLVVNVLTIRALVEGEMSVFGGMQYRPLLHVRNLATFIMGQFADREVGVFNVVEKNYQIVKIAEIIREILLHEKIDIDVVEAPVEDRRDYRVSSEKARKILSFSPHLTVRDTVEDIARIHKEGRVKDFSNIRYSNMLALQLKKQSLYREVV